MTETPSFDDIYVSHCSFVYKTLRRFGVRTADLEDLVHDVFLRVHQRWDDYDPDRPVRPWLSGFVFRVASEHTRRASTRRELLSDSPPEPVLPTGGQPDELLQAQRARSLVMAALDDLPLERRAVFVLHELEGLAVPEIASSLNVPLNTAYSRLRLGRRDFARSVRELRRPRGAA